MGPFGPLNNKEYTMIKTPKGPIILINPPILLGSWKLSGSQVQHLAAPGDLQASSLGFHWTQPPASKLFVLSRFRV